MIPRRAAKATKPEPDTLPDTHDPTGPCPRCGRHSSFELIAWTPLVVEAGIEDWDRVGIGQASEGVAVLRCRGCHEGTAVIEEVKGTSHEFRYSGVFWWPLPRSSTLDAIIPESLRKLFADADKCLAANVPDAAGVMFRRCLEGIVRDKGSQQAIATLDAVNGGLAKALKEMSTDGTLHPTLSQWAKTVRLGGNTGGHYSPGDELDATQARDLGKFVDQLFNYLYVMPAKVQAAQQTPASTPGNP